MNEREQTPALSRRAARLACRTQKAGIVARTPQDGITPTASAEDTEISGGGAMNAILQCEVTGYVDSKILRRIQTAARQLPTDSSTGKAVCIRFLRGVCAYQDSINGGNCQYAHLEIKPSKLKKFSQLMDFVCGRDSDSNLGGKNDNKRGPRRGSRSSSFGSEIDGYGEESYLMEGTSPEKSPAFSSSPNVFSSSPLVKDAAINDFPPRLDLACLLRLELTNCEGLTGASLYGSSLVHLSLHGCKNLTFLDLWAPELHSLNLSECINLSTLTLPRESLRKLQVAIFTNCRGLKESFISKFVDHCRGLCQLHIFGSGASEKGTSNNSSRQKVRTKAAKLTGSRPNLEIFTTKKDSRLTRASSNQMT
mmetsp:Transcript_9986/g.14395  ORF Transcript_9986/g.14395 Transcript_9986/m.14395 type:complete len:365 (+) Transcript_9986:256-1350(+)